MQNIKINNQELVVKEYKEQRVITLREVDEVHARPSGTARAAFNRNKEHFVLGKDYFVPLMDEAWKLLEYPAPRGVTLLTETGYLMLVKPFGDDLSWKIQRELVNNYFNQKPLVSTASVVVEKEKKSYASLSQRDYADIPENPQAQRLIKEIREQTITINHVLEQFNKYNELERQESYCNILSDFGNQIASSVYDLGKVSYGKVTGKF